MSYKDILTFQPNGTIKVKCITDSETSNNEYEKKWKPCNDGTYLITNPGDKDEKVHIGNDGCLYVLVNDADLLYYVYTQKSDSSDNSNANPPVANAPDNDSTDTPDNATGSSADNSASEISGLITDYGTDQYNLPDFDDFTSSGEIDLISYFYACGAKDVRIRGYNSYGDANWKMSVNEFAAYTPTEDDCYISIEGRYDNWYLDIIYNRTGIDPVAYPGVTNICYEFYLPGEKEGWYDSHACGYLRTDDGTYSYKKIRFLDKGTFNIAVYEGCFNVLPKLMYTFLNCEKTPGMSPQDVYNFDEDIIINNIYSSDGMLEKCELIANWTL